ncbi:MAG: hypothetical protein M3340_09580 [Actinomycetota bacterium]|nr:hypothetical protein [Actinomycetota bacterium]
MSAAQVGSIQWARESEGLLSTRREELEMLRQCLRYVAHRTPTVIGARFGRRRRPRADYALTDVHMPRTKAGRLAEELLSERLEPVWVEHCFRTYLFGWVIGRYDGLDFDEEMLLVTSLVHDLSLADSNLAVRQRCFSLTAAEILDDVTSKAGWDPDRRERACDAMTRHINMWIAARETPEAYLLHIGSKLDVVGMRHWDLSPRLVDEILERHPRLGFKSVFRPKMRAHAGAVPMSRAGWYGRRIQSDKRRAKAPFPE